MILFSRWKNMKPSYIRAYTVIYIFQIPVPLNLEPIEFFYP
jgi:hypothetical protein